MISQVSISGFYKVNISVPSGHKRIQGSLKRSEASCGPQHLGCLVFPASVGKKMDNLLICKFYGIPFRGSAGELSPCCYATVSPASALAICSTHCALLHQVESALKLNWAGVSPLTSINKVSRVVTVNCVANSRSWGVKFLSVGLKLIKMSALKKVCLFSCQKFYGS